MAPKKKLEKGNSQRRKMQNSTKPKNKGDINKVSKPNSKAQNSKPENSNKKNEVNSQKNKKEKCETSNKREISENSQNNNKETCNTIEDSNSQISNDRDTSENSHNTIKKNNQNNSKTKTNQDKTAIANKNIEENQNNSRRKSGYSTPEPKFTKPPSLMNFGATCYLNSALQGISSCDIFLEELYKLHKKYAKLEKLSLFHKLIDILNGGKSDYLEISRNPIFRNWNKYGQQDSFELLAYVMNQVYNEIRKHLENEGDIPKLNMQKWLKVELPMRIIIEYEIKCACNNEVQVPLQSDLALHIPIPTKNISDLQTLVEQFFNEDDIEDYKCDSEGCNGKGAKRYIHLLQPLPKTLCIHLQRTFWDRWKMKKIDNYIQFPKTIEIKSKFTVSCKSETKNEIVNKNDKIVSDHSQELSNNHSLKLPENGFQPNLINDQNFSEKYYLASVIVHYGSVYGGHYVCYKKMNDKWFLTNDSSIKEISENEVLDCNAYILFYEKNRADLKKDLLISD